MTETRRGYGVIAFIFIVLIACSVSGWLYSSLSDNNELERERTRQLEAQSKIAEYNPQRIEEKYDGIANVLEEQRQMMVEERMLDLQADSQEHNQELNSDMLYYILTGETKQAYLKKVETKAWAVFDGILLFPFALTLCILGGWWLFDVGGPKNVTSFVWYTYQKNKARLWEDAVKTSRNETDT